MKITFDAAKRARNAEEKGLDFERAGEVFEGATITVRDERRNTGKRGS
jgi:uncharacterized DUF497 family protein